MENINSESKTSFYFFLCLASPFIAAAGIWFPIVKTNTGLSYSIVNIPSLIIYGLCIFVLIANIVADRVDLIVAKRLIMLTVIVLGGCLVYASGVYKDGVEWIYSQSLYDATGMHWTLNGVDYDWNRITSMTIVEKAEELSIKGGNFLIYPPGFLMIIIAIAIQVYFASKYIMKADKNSESNETQGSNDKIIVKVLACVAFGLAIFTGPSLSSDSFGVSETKMIPKTTDKSINKNQPAINGADQNKLSNNLEEQPLQQKNKTPPIKKTVPNLQEKSNIDEGDLSLDKYRNLVEGIK